MSIYSIGAEIAKNAADMVEHDGLAKHEFGSHEGAKCAVAAVLHCTTPHVHGNSTRAVVEHRLMRDAVLKRLAAHWGLKEITDESPLPTPTALIMDYNDRESTTQDDVVSALRVVHEKMTAEAAEHVQ